MCPKIGASTFPRVPFIGRCWSMGAKEKEREGQVLWDSGVKGEEPPPPRKGEKEQLGVSMDGMTVWVDGDRHEVKVGCCFRYLPS